MIDKFPVWLYLLMILVIIGLKISFFSVRLGDYNTYLLPWIKFIKAHNYFESLKFDFYNYAPSYIYILILIAKTGLNPLFAIKAVSVIFEYLMAFYVGRILNLKYKNTNIIWLSLVLLPVIPTVFINGAYWGQCDAVFSFFVVASLYYLLNNNKIVSVLMLAIAFAFKVQTVFILPLFFILILRGKIKWYFFGIIPLIYIVSILPIWLAGRSFIDGLLIYYNQSGYYKSVTLFMPNLYIWLQNSDYNIVKLCGTIFTIILTLISGLLVSIRRIDIDKDAIILIGFGSVMIVPYILPGMHERYLYLSDIFAFIWIFWNRKNIQLPFSILLVSLYSYMSCSRLQTILPLWPGFVLYSYSLVLMFIELKKLFAHRNIFLK